MVKIIEHLRVTKLLGEAVLTYYIVKEISYWKYRSASSLYPHAEDSLSD